MNNPLSILPIVFRARRPSDISDMPARQNSFWLRSGFEALTFFGVIITHSEKEASLFNHSYSALKNHEMIHLRQAQSCGNSWWLFYIRYLWYWLCAIPQNLRHLRRAYYLNPFEIEAYRHMNDLGYAPRCAAGGANEWRRYARLTVGQRKKLFPNLK